MEPLRPGDPAQVGSYQLVCRLGDTGLGQAYGGRRPGGGPLVTVTVLHPRLAQDPRFRDRFRLDVNNARRVTGAYVVPVDADTESASPWLASGSPDAPSLDAVVADSGPLPPHAIRELAVALTGALVSVHEAGARLVGLEPSNVMMTPEGPRLSHVGITHMAQFPQTAAGGGQTEADAVHSVGAVLHFAATGRPPAPASAAWQPGPPPVADAVLGPLIADCLAAQPAARPTLRDLVSRLSGAAAPGAIPGATVPGTLHSAPGGPPGAGAPGAPLPPAPGGIPPMPVGPQQPWWRTVPGPVVAAAVVLAAIAALAFSAGGGSDDTFGAPPAAGSTASLPQGLPTLPGDLPTDDGTNPDDDGGDPSDDPSTPTDPPTQDPIATAETGDCFDNAGTAQTADLTPTDCQPGVFKAVQVLHGTTVTSGCDNVPGDDWNVAYSESDVVLCLSYQYEHGSAYHAKPGACVYGTSAAADWDELDCQTGAFTVLERYTGTTDGSRCKGIRNEDWSEHFGVSGRSDLGVVLCLSMVYPDDAGHATLHECLRFTGSSTRPSLHAVSCNAANVVVTGRTPTYNNSKFCGTDAWATWKPNNYPSLAYTLCYRYR